MYLASGSARTRFSTSISVYVLHMVSRAKALIAAHQSVFLEFSDGLYYPLHTDSDIQMAANLVFLHHTRDFDSDGWIAEAHMMGTLLEETSEGYDGECFDSDDNGEETM